MNNIKTRVDARDYQPKDKHATILKAFNSLLPNEAMELTNDHDPRPLYYQFSAEMPDTFTWEYLEQGPDVYRVAITKK